MSETRIVSPKEVWAAPAPTDLMAWAVCPYLRDLQECQSCPEWDEDKDYGKCKRGCRALAEEACRVVHAAKLKS
jgi:hypothetical protein